MHIGVIGAGVSGLATARVMKAVGFDVTVFEKAPDVGGVWSSTRSYPGISTQDDRRSYAFSDFPMPADFPEHPSGAQVRGYLQDYVLRHDLGGHIRLNTTVELAERAPSGSGWRVSSTGPAGSTVDDVDVLVLANGIFSTPHVPGWAGLDEFEAAGGRVLTPSELGDGAELAGRRVAIVGWGKTALDVASASAGMAASTEVVARAIRWKHPKRIGARLTFQHLLLTRAGEFVLGGTFRSFAGRVLVFAGRPFRRWADARLATVVARQLDLEALGLLPTGPYADSNALVSEGFFEAVADGRITVHRERSVASLGSTDEGPAITLSDGRTIPIDVLVPATGYEQSLDVIAADVRARLLEPSGDLLLHRKIVSVTVPDLAFVGWSHTFHSPVSSEIAALWLAHRLLSRAPEPSADDRSRAARYLLTHARAGQARSAQIPAATFGDLDEMLEDMGMRFGVLAWARQLVTAFDPSAYSTLLPRLQKRFGVPAARPSEPSPASGTVAHA